MFGKWSNMSVGSKQSKNSPLPGSTSKVPFSPINLGFYLEQIQKLLSLSPSVNSNAGKTQ